MAVAILVSEKIFNFSELVDFSSDLARTKSIPVIKDESQIFLALLSYGDL